MITINEIKIEIKDYGVKKNKGQGYTAWIKSNEGGYYTKYCMIEKEGNKILQSLNKGDMIFLKYQIKNGFSDFLSYQIELKKEHPKTDEDNKDMEEEIKKMKAIEEKLIKEEQAKEEEFYKFYVEHYTSAIKTAKEIVSIAEIDNKDPLYVSIVVTILDKIATPKVYLKQGWNKK